MKKYCLSRVGDVEVMWKEVEHMGTNHIVLGINEAHRHSKEKPGWQGQQTRPTEQRSPSRRCAFKPQSRLNVNLKCKTIAKDTGQVHT